MATGAATAPVAGQDRPFSLALSGSFTTASKVFTRPADPDEFLRSQFFPLDGIFSAGIDLRRALPPGNLQLGLGVEYLTRSTTTSVPYGSVSLPVTDGFAAIPVELTGYFYIPIGTDVLRVFMGGGTGLYFGRRRYEYGGTPAETTERRTGFGIHVLTGAEWFIGGAFSLRSEVKFRDVQFETVNQFLRPSTFYQGTTIPLPSAPIPSRINIDGIVLSFGIACHF